MTLSVKHNFVSTKPATANTQDVDGPKWNEDHVVEATAGTLLGAWTSGDGTVTEVTLGSGLDLSTSGILSMSGSYSGSLTTTGTITLDSASDAEAVLSAGASGDHGYIYFYTGDLKRWTIGKNDDAESGSEAGSNFGFYRYDDSGSYIDAPFQLTRSTGNASFVANVTVEGNLDLTNNSYLTGDASSVVWNFDSNDYMSYAKSGNAFEVYINAVKIWSATSAVADFPTTPVKTLTTVVASLPAAGTVGAGSRAFVTDANATTFASVVAGGGANGVPVYSDGTNWRIG